MKDKPYAARLRSRDFFSLETERLKLDLIQVSRMVNAIDDIRFEYKKKLPNLRYSAKLPVLGLYPIKGNIVEKYVFF